MNRKRNCLRRASTALCSLLLLALPASAAETLSIEQCIRLALEENFDIRISRNAIERAEQDEIIAHAQYLPEFSLSRVSSFSTETASDTDLDGAQNPQSDRENTAAEVSQRLDSGATVTLSSALNKRTTNSQRSLLNPAYDADVALRVVQPLLSGFGPDVAKAQRRLSELEVEQQQWSFADQVLTTINSAERSYHEVVFAQEQLTIRETALELAEQLLDENQTKMETGIATSLDVLQAEVGVANARDRLLRARSALQDAKDALLNAIGIDPGSLDFDTTELDDPQNGIPTIETLFQRALAKQPRYQTLLNQIEQREVELARARRNRLPTLNLNGIYAHTGLRATAGSAFDEVPTGNSYNWQVNLSVEAPWGLRDRRADFQKARIQLNTEETRALKEKQAILRSSRSAIRDARLAQESAEIKSLATRLSEEEFEMEKAKFDSGLSTGRRVLEAQQRMNEARVDELRSRVDLLDAFSNLRRIDGTSLTRYRIEVDR